MFDAELITLLGCLAVILPFPVAVLLSHLISLFSRISTSVSREENQSLPTTNHTNDWRNL